MLDMIIGYSLIPLFMLLISGPYLLVSIISSIQSKCGKIIKMYNLAMDLDDNPSVSVINYPKFRLITYKDERNVSHQVVVPRDREAILTGPVLALLGEKTVNITQEPGAKYRFTPYDIGADKIIVMDVVTGEDLEYTGTDLIRME